MKSGHDRKTRSRARKTKWYIEVIWASLQRENSNLTVSSQLVICKYFVFFYNMQSANFPITNCILLDWIFKKNLDEINIAARNQNTHPAVPAAHPIVPAVQSPHPAVTGKLVENYRSLDHWHCIDNVSCNLISASLSVTFLVIAYQARWHSDNCNDFSLGYYC